jgi:general secretion pathway protein D
MSTARKSVSDISTGITNSSGSGGAAGAPSTNAGSTSKVDNTNDSDFWKDIDAGLKQLLAASDTYTPLASLDEPVAVPEPPPPPPAPADGKAPAVPPPPSSLPPSLNVSSAPAAAPVKSAPASYSISKETGIVSVFATERQHKLVQKFFDNYRRQSTTQVLIEAKVLEVTLNDQFATGIDWGAFNLPSPGFIVPDTTGGIFKIALRTKIDGGDYKSILQALSQFGTVRSLSSPRVTVMNNQAAVVNVAENLVYFNIKATVTPATTNSSPTVSYDSTQESVPDGVLLNVTPTANPDTGEIILAVRPTVSKEVDTVNDPSVALNILGNGGSAADVPNSPIPEMSVQEIDSIIKMQSGQTMVMGGLMKDANTVSQVGVPVLGDIPGIGILFHSHQDQVQKSELVIFLRASIVPGSNVEDMDRKAYKEFGNDTRPFPM